MSQTTNIKFHDFYEWETTAKGHLKAGFETIPIPINDFLEILELAKFRWYELKQAEAMNNKGYMQKKMDAILASDDPNAVYKMADYSEFQKMLMEDILQDKI